MLQPGAGCVPLGLTGGAVSVAGAAGRIVMGRGPTAGSEPVGSPRNVHWEVEPAAGTQLPTAEEVEGLSVHRRRAAVVAQIGVGSRGTTGVVGPHGEGDGVLGERVAVRVAVLLWVQEALALL